MFFFPVLGLLCTRGRIHYAEPCHFCQVCSSYLDVLECPEYSAGKSLCLFQIVSVMLTQTTFAPISREFYLCPEAKKSASSIPASFGQLHLVGTFRACHVNVTSLAQEKLHQYRIEGVITCMLDICVDNVFDVWEADTRANTKDTKGQLRSGCWIPPSL